MVYSLIESYDCGGECPLIKIVNQEIIVASYGGRLRVLDTKLNVKKEYNKIDYMPQCLAATKVYIAVGTREVNSEEAEEEVKKGDEVIFYNRNGSTKPEVSVKSNL